MQLQCVPLIVYGVSRITLNIFYSEYDSDIQCCPQTCLHSRARACIHGLFKKKETLYAVCSRLFSVCVCACVCML